MKTLESLKKFQINLGAETVIGGVRMTGSFSSLGTTYAYDGDMFLTQNQSGLDVHDVGGMSNTSNVNDFTGCISVDGHGQCNSWTNVSITF